MLEYAARVGRDAVSNQLFKTMVSATLRPLKPCNTARSREGSCEMNSCLGPAACCKEVRGHLADLLTGIRTTPKLASNSGRMPHCINKRQWLGKYRHCTYSLEAWRLAAADGVLRIAAVAVHDLEAILLRHRSFVTA